MTVAQRQMEKKSYALADGFVARRNVFFLCLLLAVLSGVAASHAIYESRLLTTELAHIQKSIQQKQVQQNSLHIEQGLHGSFNHIERKAKKVLNMTSPSSENIVVLAVDPSSGGIQ